MKDDLNLIKINIKNLTNEEEKQLLLLLEKANNNDEKKLRKRYKWRPKLGPQTNQTIDEKCPECGGDLVIRKGKYGLFKGCKNYPACHFMKSLK